MPKLRGSGSTVRSGLLLDEQKVVMLEHHMAGMTIQEIADECGVSYRTAYERIRATLSDVKSLAVDEYRKVHDLQCQALFSKAVEFMEHPDVEVQMKGFDRFLAVMNRHARLHGLDAETKVSISGEVVTISDETEVAIAKAQGALKALTAKTAASAPPLRAVE